ncbi:hypothetical protein HG530_004946 [Fusarium avenaceum]|nr:hypothetical protein HG530_004946 [Fusarium avenaceum]
MGIGDRVEACGLAVLFLQLLQKALELLENPPNFLLAHACQVEYLTEGARYVVLSAGDEDAASNDGFLGLSLEELVLIHELEDVLGSVGDVLAHVDSFAKRDDLLVRQHEALLRFILVGIVLRPGQSLVGLGLGEGYGCRELLTFDKLILGTTDTAGIVTTLVVVCKILAYCITAGELLDQVRRTDVALGAH